MRNRGLVGAGIALAIALTGAQAQAQFFGPYPPGAFYLGPEGGWTHLFSQTPGIAVQGPAGLIVTPRVNPTFNYDSGFNAGARAGYAWGPWRFEGEYSYSNNNISSSSRNNVLINPSGSTHSNAIMANAIYDFTLGWPITPHIGGGIGAVDVFRSIGGGATVTAENTFTTTGPNGRVTTIRPAQLSPLPARR